jgi:hypothetical protein
VIDERKQAAILARTFFSRMFESDLMPPGMPQVQIIVSVFAFIAAPSLILPLWLLKKYVVPPPRELMLAMMASDRTMALLLSMTATAFITLAIWENIFPDRRDSRNLGVLPVRARSFVIARLYAIVVVFAIVFLGTTAISSVGFGIVGSMAGLSEGMITRTLSHFLAVAAAEAFVFFGIVAVQCALLSVTGPSAAHKVAVVLQILLIVAVLQMPLVLPTLSNFVLDGDGVPRWSGLVSASVLPPLWFLSLYQALIGQAYAGTDHLVRLASVLGGLMPLFALGLYAGSYRRLTRLAIEGQPVPAEQRAPLASRLVGAASRAFTSVPSAAGVCAFTIRTLVRSRQHRMLIAVWIGVALALTISAALPMIVRFGVVAFDRPHSALLAGPLIFAALIQTGMRSLFAIPVEIKANWTFRLREPLELAPALSGAAAAMILCGVVPPAGLAFLTGALLWGVGIGVKHAIFCGVLATGFSQFLMRGVDRVPFTCTYTPGTAHIGKLWPLYLTMFSVATYGMASLEEEILGTHQGFLITVFIFGIIAATLAWFRLREARQVITLRFEEEPGDGLTLVHF